MICECKDDFLSDFEVGGVIQVHLFKVVTATSSPPSPPRSGG